MFETRLKSTNERVSHVISVVRILRKDSIKRQFNIDLSIRPE